MAAEADLAPETPAARAREFAPGDAEEKSRVLALSDGVFAFALTLLALSLTVPIALRMEPPPAQSIALAQYLAMNYAEYVGYAEAFLLIGVWWTVHKRMFRIIPRSDISLSWLNLGFLAFIAITPFVVTLVTQVGINSTSAAVYSGVQAFAALFLALIAVRASRDQGLSVTRFERSLLEQASRRTFLISGLFALSIGLGYASPVWGPQAAQIFWLVIAGVTIVGFHRMHQAEQRRRPVA